MNISNFTESAADCSSSGGAAERCTWRAWAASALLCSSTHDPGISFLLSFLQPLLVIMFLLAI